MIEMDHRFFVWRKPDTIVPKAAAWTHEFWSDFGGQTPLAKAISKAEIIRIHGKKHILDFKHFRATKKQLSDLIIGVALYMFFIIERDKINEYKWIGERDKINEYEWIGEHT